MPDRSMKRVPRLRIGRAGDRGQGVFATTELPVSGVVIRYDGAVKWVWEIPSDLWPHCFQMDYDRYVLPREGSPGWYLNHSCEPNCVIEGAREIVAVRRILPGEELTIDYSTNVGWEGFEMECRCGSGSCRGVIRSYSFLDSALKTRYGSNVSKFLTSRRRPS